MWHPQPASQTDAELANLAEERFISSKAGRDTLCGYSRAGRCIPPLGKSLGSIELLLVAVINPQISMGRNNAVPSALCQSSGICGLGTVRIGFTADRHTACAGRNIPRSDGGVLRAEETKGECWIQSHSSLRCSPIMLRGAAGGAMRG